MSTNNQVVIIEKEDGFYLYENPCVDDDFVPSARTLLVRTKTLREAIKSAQRFCNTYPYVEYGYTIQLMEGK